VFGMSPNDAIPVAQANAESPRGRRLRKPLPKHRIRPKDIRTFVDSLVGENIHAKRVLSLSNGVSGVVHAATLGVHAIGQGLAQAQGLAPKHAVKQVDRLLSNAGVLLATFFAHWVPFLIGARAEVFLALDWTEFDGDDHSTIALYLVTSHGRATPLLWRTVQKSKLKGWRNQHEDDLLALFAQLRPPTLARVTVLADRGFGDQGLYCHLADDLHLDFVIRFKGCIAVQAPSGEVRRAAEWVPDNGRAKKIPGAQVTGDRTPVGAVVCVHARGMKEPWCLATSRVDLSASADSSPPSSGGAAPIASAASTKFRSSLTFPGHRWARRADTTVGGRISWAGPA
jgi:hypothetical protein